MDTNPTKTTSYDDFIEHLMWAFDLYETNNRTPRLRDKRSYATKQDLYRAELAQNFIQAISDQSPDAVKLITGLFYFSEKVFSFVYSKPVITSLEKEKVYQAYYRHIFCPLLIAYIEIFSDFHDCSPIMRHLDTLLMSTKEEGIAHAARKMLISTLDAPECKIYRDEMIEFISGIRSNRTQRRATISQKIGFAIKSCNSITNNEERKKCLHTLASLHDAYTACMAMIYFDIQTGLGETLAKLHQKASIKRPSLSDIRIDSLSGSIVKSMLNSHLERDGLSVESKKYINELWRNATSKIPEITSPYVKQNINTLFYLLGIPIDSTLRITDQKKSEKFFHRVATHVNMAFLKPYAIMLKVMYHIENNCLQDALELLKSDEAKSVENAVGLLPYYAAALQIALTIKGQPKEIKNGTLNPLINTIINSQPLYVVPHVDDNAILGLNFEPLFSAPYSISILRSIEQYNSIVFKCSASHRSPYEFPCQMIINTWDDVERMLTKVYKKINGSKKHYKPILTDAEKAKSLITYLPNSTLYNCVRELHLLSSFLTRSPVKHPYISKLFDDFDSCVESRKHLLEAIDPDQYRIDSGS